MKKCSFGRISANKIKFVITLLGMIALSNSAFGQDTIRLMSKPQVIVKSWYPELKKFPKLKIGETKILFALIPDFENYPVRDNDINLVTSNSQINIEETEKINQYLVTVNPTNETFVEFKAWFEIGNNTILLKQNSNWINIEEIYTVKDNRILIDIIKLKIVD